MGKTGNGQAPVRVALIQMAMAADPKANVAKAEQRIADAVKKGANIVCLPELYRSLYFPQTEDVENFQLAESATTGPSAQRMAALAKQHKVVVIVPIFEKRASGVYHNSALVFDADGKVAGHYRKMHIPDDPEFYEKFYFAPGDLGFPVFDTKHGRIGVLICWDQWFPEAARLAALRGAQILFYPTAIGHHEHLDEATIKEQRDAWEIVQRGHAVANGVFVASVNRVGQEGKVRFWGHSFLVNPFGAWRAHASTDDEELLLADVDLAEIDRVRHGWPFLRDRRIDAYGALHARFIDEAAKE